MAAVKQLGLVHDGTMVPVSVGATVWYQPNDLRETGHETAITAIGSRWVTVDRGTRFELSTWMADAGRYSSAGRYWPSRDVWAAEEARRQTWDQLHRIPSAPPDGVTLADIQQALQLLGLTPKGDL